jgi:hypothetical protein
MVSAVNHLAARVYRDVEPLPIERYEQWLLVNPSILVCLKDSWGYFQGYFDVYPLTDSFFDLFEEGLVGEQEIRHVHILPPEKMRLCRRIYLAGLAVENSETMAGKWHASCLIWGLLRYLEFFYGLSEDRLLFASGVTLEGTKLLERFHFRQVLAPEVRCDPYPLFVSSLTGTSIQLAIHSFPDWTPICQLGWVTKKNVDNIDLKLRCKTIPSTYIRNSVRPKRERRPP